jgi:hypothetical protein
MIYLTNKIKKHHKYARMDEMSLREAVEYLSRVVSTHDRTLYSDFRLRYVDIGDWDRDRQEYYIICDRLETDAEHVARDQRDIEAKSEQRRRNELEFERLKKELGK